VKRTKRLSHLRQQGCQVLGEGRRHTQVVNPANRARSIVPRHREINDRLVQEICKQLGVSPPAGT
jgi:mRNA interferase HicA